MPKTCVSMGQSGVEELARQITVESVYALISIAKDTKAVAADRVFAAKAVLDIGWGEPVQHIELRQQMAREGPPQASEMTLEQLFGPYSI